MTARLLDATEFLPAHFESLPDTMGVIGSVVVLNHTGYCVGALSFGWTGHAHWLGVEEVS